VSAAILFDLELGSPDAYPDAEAGWRACEAARSDGLEEGCVGVGTGATVGKVLGIKNATKSGLGTAALRLTGGAVVGALVAVNALGDVVNPVTGQIIAGSRDPTTGATVSAVAQILRRTGSGPAAGTPTPTNTTIGVVATAAKLSRDGLSRVAALAHDGLPRVVRPAHTPYDGDTFFALATGQSDAAIDPTVVAVGAGEVVATAIVRAVMAATPLGGLPSATNPLVPPS